MFNRKECRRCGKKTSKSSSYCPNCGQDLRDFQKEQKDYGFLGKEDVFPDMKLPFGFNFLLKNLMKEMDKQFRDLDSQIGRDMREDMREIKKPLKEQEKQRLPFSQKGGISINISSGQGKPIVRVKSFGNMPEFRKQEQELRRLAKPQPRHYKHIEIDENRARELSKLPRKEAESKVRRLSGKVVYEIDVPGVKNIKDVIINELENSIEIKAFAKETAYFKFLPISLPLLRYRLLKEKLILELGEKNRESN